MRLHRNYHLSLPVCHRDRYPFKRLSVAVKTLDPSSSIAHYVPRWLRVDWVNTGQCLNSGHSICSGKMKEVVATVLMNNVHVACMHYLNESLPVCRSGRNLKVVHSDSGSVVPSPAQSVGEVRTEERQPEGDEDGEHPYERSAGSALATVHADDAETVAAGRREADVAARRTGICSGVYAQVVGLLGRLLGRLLLRDGDDVVEVGGRHRGSCCPNLLPVSRDPPDPMNSLYCRSA